MYGIPPLSHYLNDVNYYILVTELCLVLNVFPYWNIAV
jgi:hypothetical protein